MSRSCTCSNFLLAVEFPTHPRWLEKQGKLKQNQAKCNILIRPGILMIANREREGKIEKTLPLGIPMPKTPHLNYTAKKHVQKPAIAPKAKGICRSSPKQKNAKKTHRLFHTPKTPAWTKILHQVVHFPDVLRNPTLPARHGFSSEKCNKNERISRKLLEWIAGVD